MAYMIIAKTTLQNIACYFSIVVMAFIIKEFPINNHNNQPNQSSLNMSIWQVNKNWSRLVQDIDSMIPNNQTWSVVVSDPINNIKIERNSQQRIHAASTMKLLTGVATLKTFKNLNAFIYGDSVLNHLTKMINRSDNQSWEALNNTLTYQYLDRLAKDLGLHNTNPSENISSASDMAKLLTAINQTDLLSENDRQILFGLMTDTETENRLSPAFTKGTWVHKTGTYQQSFHDVGILFLDHPYIIAVYTQTDDYLKTTQEMNNFSYQVNNILNNRPNNLSYVTANH